MKKKYSSKVSISLNVHLKSGANVHISFMPLSNGGSIYITENEEIQEGLEHHYRFNSLFKLDGKIIEEEPKVEAPKNEEPKVRVVNVASLQDAKDYLADHFNVSRTLLRSEKSIVEQGAAHGVQFEGYK